MLPLAAPPSGSAAPSAQAPPAFDNLVLGREHGLRIAGLLGEHVGSVVVDPEAVTCTFFVMHNGDDERPPRLRPSGKVPATTKTRPPGAFWLTAPECDRPVLTPLDELQAALLKDLSPADTWLVETATNPGRAAELWAHRSPAPLQAGIAWDAVQMPLGLATMVMARMEEAALPAGPLMAAGADNLAWWLVPAQGPADVTALPDEVCLLSAGHILSVPQPRRYAGDRTWLIPPLRDTAVQPVPLTSSTALLRAVSDRLPDWRQRT